jgi:GMP synthase-like glutamine amidotransferase
MRIHIIQHIPASNATSSITSLCPAGITFTISHSYNKHCSFPNTSEYDLLIILGGPMSTCDTQKYPWLNQEKKYIQDAINADKYIMGICLGAQLLAEALGGEVSTSDELEIGWHKVSFNDALKSSILAGIFPSQMELFHWHKDTFTLPRNAIAMGHSLGCANQGFVYNDRIIGFQFHLEATAKWAHALSEEFPEDEMNTPLIQTTKNIQEQENLFTMSNQLLNQVIQRIDTLSTLKQ